jgi:uncharacterized protein YlxW (UPF0749 family)
MLMFSLVGCASTSAGRVAQLQGAMSVAQNQVQTLEAIVEQCEAATQEAQAFLADPNLLPGVREKIVSQAAAVETQLQQYRPRLQALQSRIEQLQDLIAQAQAGEMDWAKEIQTYGQSITAGSAELPGPLGGYGALLGLALTFVGGVAGFFTRAKKAQADLDTHQQQTDNIVAGIVGSVNALLQSSAVPNPDAAKQVLQDYQTENCPEARAAVRKAQGLVS